MVCSCGGETAHRVHTVGTLEVAKEWYPDTEEDDSPILVRRDVCTSCGRERKWDRKKSPQEDCGLRLSIPTRGWKTRVYPIPRSSSL
jgi:hypothetical protein